MPAAYQNRTVPSLAEFRLLVADRPEVRFNPGPHRTTIVSIAASDLQTYENPSATECRGMVFDSAGKVCSRPLHKFFNAHERGISVEECCGLTGRWMPKLDGSLIATACVGGRLLLRSKTSFDSDAAKSATAWLHNHPDLHRRLIEISEMGMTVSMEWTCPSNQIVLRYPESRLTVLHARLNQTGQYADAGELRSLLRGCDGYLVGSVPAPTPESIEALTEAEGFVLQTPDGDMLKLKSPWYLRLHRICTMLTERNVAEAVLDETADDILSAMTEVGVSVEEVSGIARRVKEDLLGLEDFCRYVCGNEKDLTRKQFALKYGRHERFGVLISLFTGQRPDYRGFYRKWELPKKFSTQKRLGTLK